MRVKGHHTAAMRARHTRATPPVAARFKLFAGRGQYAIATESTNSLPAVAGPASGDIVSLIGRIRQIMATARLSKSLFQSGRQCHKRLWLEVHRRDLLDEMDQASKARSAEGTHFGLLARELLGGGALVAAESFDVASAQTQALLAQAATHSPMLFEAAFEHEGVCIRVDAMVRFPLADRLIEVKSSTSAKDVYLWDCAIQTWVMRGAGRPVQTVSLALVNNRFVYEREGEYDGLLKLEDQTESVEALLPRIPHIVDELKALLAGPQPQITTGPQCKEPYECPFFQHCRASEPPAPTYPVEDLPRAKAVVESLRSAGYVGLQDVPPELLHNPMHQRIAEAVRTGQAYVSPELTDVLDGIPYPRYYLDFETISFIVPRWLGSRPFQQVPFQFSCHVEHSDGTVNHSEFLDLTGRNPMPGFVDALLAATAGTGPIIVWNQGFEAGRVREMAEAFPDKAMELQALIDRMVDLLPVYRDRYYHRDMHGSWSIKKVLPVTTALDYDDLEIGDGVEAQQGYLRAIAADVSTTEREQLRQRLLKYCGRDTWAMVRLVQWRP